MVLALCLSLFLEDPAGEVHHMTTTVSLYCRLEAPGYTKRCIMGTGGIRLKKGAYL